MASPSVAPVNVLKTRYHVIVAVLLETRVSHLRFTLLYRGIIFLQFANGTTIGKISLLAVGLFLVHVFLIGARHLESGTLRTNGSNFRWKCKTTG